MFRACTAGIPSFIKLPGKRSEMSSIICPDRDIGCNFRQIGYMLNHEKGGSG
jgi:hypothetical protein